MTKKNRDIEIEMNDILRSIGLDDNSISAVISNFETEVIPKGKVFLKEKEKSKKIGILLKGLLFAYSTNVNGEKNVSRFFYSPENLIVVNFQSFLENKPSEETIESIEDSYLLILKKDALLKLYADFPEMNRIGRMIAEVSYIKALNKIKLLQTSDAKERIEVLMEQAPELFQKVPRGFIASYLGMHRNTFNKALSKI